ncbi:efflux transporter, outer membrane factor (OMF) lipoprotein, NodT family [Polaromonas sp. OV174]|uniref:efflux transporter outer membrane subunit n=1 Tax=Polaromonas sp. OV174 TaxID=1855300 RepID=UPI0008F3C120|nr:efflux transporter outer membrane subunit [Polaromonas sp. OV174]SFC06942.1 efflux transporter, outer membrane factor (OMF) lipoprotein, NodT family [Polaromonas sp. OV174]
MDAPCVASARLAATVLAAALLVACAAGPDYVRPTVEAPQAYKEDGPWRPAQPQRIDSQQPWWSLYADSTLDGLIAQATQANQNIAQAEAQVRQAHAIADAARAGFFPTVGATANAVRARTDTNANHLGNTVSVGLQAGWEPDLWGGVRRAVEAGKAGSQASADDLAAARLSVQATLAQDYFQLRTTDRQIALYERTVAAYRKALALTQAQYNAGVTLRSDVALAQTQLEAADAQRIDLQVQRSQLEHALAVLLGKAPAAFELSALSSLEAPPATLPLIPAGLPSELLERRPDIAGAERRAAQANANIGVARSAYYPALTLGASLGSSAASLATLFTAPASVWSLGATLAGTLLDGGLRKAHDAQAVAAYDLAVAQYRQTVLAGFQEVEDNLAALRVLGQESAVQERAVQAAQLSERLALSQYRAGSASYLAVVNAQTLLLTNQRTAEQLRGRQLVASVALIAATGGGWSSADSATLARTP